MFKNTNLLPGESPLREAPNIRLSNGANCIPQHYLAFEHDLHTIESVLLDIEFCDHYLLFACADLDGLYIQVGIIGFDNYVAPNIKQREKIVYGRKWRVEPQLPTSEIIQTAFLALQKAREHEIRELFRLHQHNYLSTPFNNHHDLPLMSQHSELFTHIKENHVPENLRYFRQALQNVRYDHGSFELDNMTCLNGKKWLLDIKIHLNTKTSLPELCSSALTNSITILLERLSVNELYYELMDYLLKLSNRYVEEQFQYKGFRRFSRSNSVVAIGYLSSTVRHRGPNKILDDFSNQLKAANFYVDQSRVPPLTNSKLSKKIAATLKKFPNLEGILPISNQ
jgi:hypothetical protein